MKEIAIIYDVSCTVLTSCPLEFYQYIGNWDMELRIQNHYSKLDYILHSRGYCDANWEVGLTHVDRGKFHRAEEKSTVYQI